jgi:PIN domain nuclease of toxin-antitoxin system
MLYLLDTHILIWFFNGDNKLSKTALEIILNPRNQMFASIASVWEVAIKINLGKLKFSSGVKGFLNLIYKNNFELRNIAPDYIFKLEELPFHHRDPFDRMLVATALSEDMNIITADSNISLYPVKYVF